MQRTATGTLNAGAASLQQLDPHAVWAQHEAGKTQEHVQVRAATAKPGDRSNENQEPGMAMAEPPFTTHPDDDLPRTFLRDRERRQSAGTGLASAGGYADPGRAHAIDLPPDEAGPPVTVRAFDVPFMKMVRFFIKAAVAAIPGLLLLASILFGVGYAARKFGFGVNKIEILLPF